VFEIPDVLANLVFNDRAGNARFEVESERHRQ
jgi:hypothetical protein